jgi:hypothetical protein
MSLASQILSKGGKVTTISPRVPVVVPQAPKSAKKRALESNLEGTSELEALSPERLLESLRPLIEQEVLRLTEGLLKDNQDMKAELLTLHQEIAELKKMAEKTETERMDTDVTEEVKRLRKEVDAGKEKTDVPCRNDDDSLRIECLAEKQEQYSRRESVRLFNVAECENENTNSAVVDACLSMGIAVTSQDICISHRVGRRMPHRPRPIICKFVRRDIKHSVMENKHLLSRSANWYNVGVREDLTASRNRIIQQLRQQKERFRTIDGRVEVTRSGRTIVVDNLFDLTTKLNWSTEQVRGLLRGQRQ